MIPHFESLGRAERRAAIMYMESQNKKWPAHLVDVPEDQWPVGRHLTLRPSRVLRSSEFIVQEFHENDVTRLSVNRTHVDPATMRWVDGITWEELQQVKAECGYGDREAVEVYPPDRDVVNVGNLRHLWVLPDLVPFAWRRNGKTS